MINELAKTAHNLSIKKGYYDTPRKVSELLCLIHSEVSEALEADRRDRNTLIDIKELNETKDIETFNTSFKNNVKDRFEDELADIILRVMDLAESKGINLEQHIEAKMRYNITRKRDYNVKY